MRRIVLTVALLAALVLVLYSIQIILIGFAGVLLAILLRTASDWIHRHTNIPPSWSLVLVVGLLVGVIAGNIWLFGVGLADQIDQISAAFSAAWEQIREYLMEYEWSQRLLAGETTGEKVSSRASMALTSAMELIVALVLMVFIGLYAASNPALYTTGFLRLFPRDRRPQAAQTLDALGTSLRWWLLGQMISMAAVGTMTTIGLLVLGIPLPFTLGFLTAILNFIPNIGAILSAVFAAVLAFTKGPFVVLYVLILFLLIQSLEGYVVTPLVQQRTVSLPPALTLAVQAVMGVTAGGVGLALAAPLTVVGLELAKVYANREGAET